MDAVIKGEWGNSARLAGAIQGGDTSEITNAKLLICIYIKQMAALVHTKSWLIFQLQYLRSHLGAAAIFPRGGRAQPTASFDRPLWFCTSTCFWFRDLIWNWQISYRIRVEAAPPPALRDLSPRNSNKMYVIAAGGFLHFLLLLPLRCSRPPSFPSVPPIPILSGLIKNI